jgi:multidrug efflux pump subunit AcrA (membrane-fusion protein)
MLPPPPQVDSAKIAAEAAAVVAQLAAQQGLTPEAAQQVAAQLAQQIAAAQAAKQPSAKLPVEKPSSAKLPTDQAAAQQAAAQQAQQQAAMAAMGAIDPLAVPVPPELGGPIYSWIRRLALQADLPGADKVLREAFTDLTSSLSVAIVYPGEDGLFTLGSDDEIPKEQAPIIAVAQARRAMIASHTALIPIVTTSETVAVVILTRNPRNPAYHPAEQVAAVALARESAAIVHHLAIAHLQRAEEIKADQGGLYRGEALEAHRTRGNEGVPVNLSPGWVRKTYPLLVLAILAALAYMVIARVPTYSSGSGVVVMKGTAVTAPAIGTVEKVFVKPGQHVVKGTVLVRLYSQNEADELRAAQSDADKVTIQYLYDQSDDNQKKALGTALTRVDREKDRVESRQIRARNDGTVSDIRVREGALLQTGDMILQIVDPNADPEVIAFLPGKDRPRLREKQDLQIALAGYTKSREKAIITHVSPENVGPAEAAKVIGAQLADALKLPPGAYVVVRAKLPGKQFKSQKRLFWYHHGMVAKAEVKIQDKPFLATLLPVLEKYLPD